MEFSQNNRLVRVRPVRHVQRKRELGRVLTEKTQRHKDLRSRNLRPKSVGPIISLWLFPHAGERKGERDFIRIEHRCYITNVRVNE